MPVLEGIEQVKIYVKMKCEERAANSWHAARL